MSIHLIRHHFPIRHSLHTHDTTAILRHNFFLHWVLFSHQTLSFSSRSRYHDDDGRRRTTQIRDRWSRITSVTQHTPQNVFLRVCIFMIRHSRCRSFSSHRRLARHSSPKPTYSHKHSHRTIDSATRYISFSLYSIWTISLSHLPQHAVHVPVLYCLSPHSFIHSFIIYRAPSCSQYPISNHWDTQMIYYYPMYLSNRLIDSFIQVFFLASCIAWLDACQTVVEWFARDALDMERRTSHRCTTTQDITYKWWSLTRHRNRWLFPVVHCWESLNRSLIP